MTLFDLYHELAAQLMSREDFPLPLPKWDRDYPHNVGLLSDAEESELAAIVLQLTRGMSFESWKTLDMEQRIPWMQQAVMKLPPGGRSGRMSKADVLTELARRVQNGTPTITADELARWPSGLVDEFESTGTLQITDHAKSVACDACGQDHVEQVQYVQSPPDSELRAYIGCPDVGRVRIPLHRLRRWSIDSTRLPAGNTSAEPARGILQSSVGTTDEPLSERAQLVLVAMSEMGLVDSDHRRSTEDIAAKALGSGADANSLKSVMLELKTLQMIDSKTGRGGGCWLTEKGSARGEKLRNG
jgi:hypothetical protein